MSSSSSTGRSWMYERASRNGTGINPLYMEGVTAFIQFARDNLMESDVIRCPCTRCTLNTYHTHYQVEFHLLKFGFMGGYHVWYGHGEVEGSVGHPALEEHLDGFANVVFDAAGPSFHATAEHSQMDEAPNAEAQRFYNLLHDAKQPLYPGCEQSRLEAVAKFLTIKSEGYISDATFNRMLKQVRSILPEDATLTENYYKTKKMVKKLGLAYVKVHSCRNHCMLYYGEYADLNCCHICNEPRYKPGKEPGRRQKGVPNKQMRYFPITPRLQRLYMSTKTAEHMTWHMRNRSNEGEMVHPSDGDSWKHFDSMYPQFSEEPRNVRLGLATDGFDPFSSNSTPYSCWPVFLTPYNLPPWMCMKQQYLYLTMIIPGHPGKNLDVYLKPLVDELKNLWENGVVTYDASNKQNFTMRAAVMWTIGDFPAYGMLSSWSTHGPRSCPHCMGNSKAFMLRHGKKPCYFDCHRRFLPPSHPFRRNRNNFTRGRVEKDLPPRTVTGHELFAMVSRLPDIIPGQDVNSQKIRGFGADHNWTKRSIFWELPYWHSHLLRYMIDMMHTEKNNFDNLFNTVMDVQGKSKDNLKARLDLAEICHRPELELIENNGRIMKPNASYVVSKENQKLFYAWIRGLRLPDGYASNISRCCAKKDKFVGLKTHDCHVLMERLLPLGLRGMLPNALWEAITELSNFFRDMCSTVLRRDHLEKLEESIVVTVCKLEKIFPPAFFDSMEHLVVHLPYEAKCGGPVQYRWMYPFERCMHHLKQKVRNKASVEGSIAEAYLIEEISTFCSFYFDSNVETRINRPQRNDEGGNFNCDDCLSIFKHPG